MADIKGGVDTIPRDIVPEGWPHYHPCHVVAAMHALKEEHCPRKTAFYLPYQGWYQMTVLQQNKQTHFSSSALPDSVKGAVPGPSEAPAIFCKKCLELLRGLDFIYISRALIDLL